MNISLRYINIAYDGNALCFATVTAMVCELGWGYALKIRALRLLLLYYCEVRSTG
ncbi:MAG: hypothetical protein RBG13Loki_0990 [Promethearchaeota archaeon CR_4]|nr:MAG: hypothetical protein RBG13Loki_0990 [Candidatus Lokiarchaeota archaeon CR_4]